MEFSEKWLREWINPEVNSRALCDQMTKSGLEVESIRKISNVCKGILIGEVISCIIHPNSSEWNIITVEIGISNKINVISNIFDIDRGMKIVIAPVGSIVFNNIIIKEINIEGRISQGVLCSFFELGMFEYEDNIIILPSNVPIGTDIKEYFLLNDNVIKIAITPNRFDCLGIIGIARELAVQNNMKLPSLVSYRMKSVINDTLPIILKVPDICPRYFCRIIKNIAQDVKIPIRMKEKLRRSNVNTNNVILDIIHYVSLELGLPLHVFDADCISGNIIVRMSNENKEIAVVNGNFINISKNTLLISDNDNILSIGGNVNTDVAVVTKKTKNLFIGSVFFNVSSKHKRDIHYGEKNYITNCYEYGIDPDLQECAIEYCSYLLTDIIGGSIGPLIYKIDKNNFVKTKNIKLYRNTVNQVLGFFIPDKTILNILTNLGFQVVKNFKYWEIKPPSWRFDVNIEEDVIGELIRIYGYDKITTMPYYGDMQVNIYGSTDNFLKRVKNLLIDKGFYEIITYSFVDPDIQNLLFPNKKKLLLSNPISQDMSSMRISLWPGLLATLSYNQCRQAEHVCLFETGLCFTEDKNQDIGVKQDIYLAGIAQGYIYGNKFWDHTDKKIDFYDIKGILESILEINGTLKNVNFKKGYLSCLHPGKTAAIYYFEKLIGYMGVLHPNVEKKLKLNSEIILFEILWNDIVHEKLLKIKNISYFPKSKRDISIIVSDDIPVGDIINLCKNTDLDRIKEVYVFDVYYGNNIGIGKKSLGIRFIFEDVLKTLEDYDIDLIISRCISKLKKIFKIVMRDLTYGIN
ncbi:phenylalanine--tRNA ligase subunit beta [Buchnera aphidicola]|uniref:phenylalanine--tRNA ligase subunit beta n=1 Tax=Buchnera aphidicola TaxID=9 RepID=UPI00346457DA